VLDAITFEKRGIPAAVVITEPFEVTAEPWPGWRAWPLSLCGGAAPVRKPERGGITARADKVVDRIEQLLLEN